MAFSSLDRGDAWKFIKEASFTSKGSDEPPLAIQSLNDYFATTVRDATGGGPCNILSCDQRENFTFQSILTAETQNALVSLKTSSALDMIGLQVLCSANCRRLSLLTLLLSSTEACLLVTFLLSGRKQT